MFTALEKLGYSCHVIWDSAWDKTTRVHSECFGKNTQFNSITNFQQAVEPHFPHSGKLVRDKSKEEKTGAFFGIKIFSVLTLYNIQY
ncbi:hypothetical protein FACS1894184_18660 [Clostridia bacterium]|nr:hypothetical protein FACS1894184_18660 [Clostridia bacterium]